MKNIQQMVFSGWHFRRYIGLAIGVFVAVQAMLLKDLFLGLIAGYFLFQVVSNTGCFGADGCTIPFEDMRINDEHRDTEFEEIK